MSNVAIVIGLDVVPHQFLVGGSPETGVNSESVGNYFRMFLWMRLLIILIILTHHYL